MSRIALAALAALALAGCSKKSADQGADLAADDDPAAGATATDEPAPSPEPELDPGYPEATPVEAADAAPAPATPLTAGGAVIYDATTGAATPVGWTVDATDLRFEPTVIGATDERADVQITMSSGGRSARIMTCRGLSKTEVGDVTATPSGDDVVFVACFSRDDPTDSGISRGVRVKWNPDKRIAEVADRFQTRGRADPATMDAGEAE